MKILQSLPDRFLSFVFEKGYEWGMEKGRDRVKNILLFGFFTGKRLRMSSYSLIAASLAFQLLISLIPLVVIFFSILSAYPSLYGEESRMKEFLFSHFLPASREIIEAYIENFSKRATTAGVIGFVLLLLMAVAMLGSMENAQNRIWGVEKRRPLFDRFSAFSFILIFGGAFILLSFTISAKVSSYHLTERILEIPFMRRFLYLLFPYLFSFFAFFIAYLYLPYTKVRVSSAALGGLVGGVLWELSKNGFTLYVTEVVPYSTIYGSLGAVPIFLGWVYLTWIFFISGGVVSFVYQNFSALKEEEIFRRIEGEYTPFYGVRAMILISERFLKGGEPLRKEGLARELGISEFLMEEIIWRLTSAGLIYGGTGKDLPLLPLRDPSLISVGRVLRAISGESLNTPEGGDFSDDPHYNDIKAIFTEALKESGSILERTRMSDMVLKRSEG